MLAFCALNIKLNRFKLYVFGLMFRDSRRVEPLFMALLVPALISFFGKDLILNNTWYIEPSVSGSIPLV